MQLSPKGDSNLPTEAEAEEKEMDTSKEDDLPSDKTSKEVRESFILCHREHDNIMFIAVALLLSNKTTSITTVTVSGAVYVKLSVCSDTFILLTEDPRN